MYYITSLVSLSLDTVEVTLSEPIVTGPSFFDTSRYLLSAGSGAPFKVKKILNRNIESFTDKISLWVGLLEEGREYTVTVKPQFTKTGFLGTSDAMASFVATRTKIDSLLNKMPSMYDKSPESALRTILSAMGVELETLGGSKKMFNADGSAQLSAILRSTATAINAGAVVSAAGPSTQNGAVSASATSTLIAAAVARSGRTASLAGSASVNAARGILTNRTSAATATSSLSANPGSSTAITGPLATNLEWIVDWASMPLFSNALKGAREFSSSTTAGFGDLSGTPLTLDANGYPTSLASGQSAATIMWTNGCPHKAGTYTLTWTGSGTVSIDGGPSSTSGSLTFTQSGTETVIMRISATTPGNYVKGMELRHSSDVGRTSYFTTEFINELAPYSAVRFMDWNRTNYANGRTSWSQNTPLGKFAWSGDFGVPIEAMVALCNETNKDGWFCVPHQADNTFITNMATYIRDNLRTDRKAYIEYSNETWNWGFQQTHWLDDQSGNTGADDWIKLSADKSINVMDIFSSVFAGQTSRIVRVLGCMAANSGLGTTQMDHNSAYTHHDVIAIAPYFGGSLGDIDRRAAVSTMSTTDVINEINSTRIPEALGWVDNYVSLANARSKQLVCYEAGQHLVRVLDVPPKILGEDSGAYATRIAPYPGYNTAVDALFNAVNGSAAMGTAYTTYLNGWYARSPRRIFHFTLLSKWSKDGFWGTKEFLTSADTPKTTALKNWATAHP